MTERNVVSIDIGMYNLGLVCARVHEDLTIYVDRVAKVDLAHSMHRRIPAILCKLHHSNATCDRVAHFIQEWEPWLNGATDILIERQPPTGFKDIEALLQYCFRDKVHIIQPQSIHSHFGLPHGDYEGRKAITVAIAHHHLKGCRAGWASRGNTTWQMQCASCSGGPVSSLDPKGQSKGCPLKNIS